MSCKVCGKPANKTYCSLACYYEDRRQPTEERVCKACRNTFVVRVSSGKQFCCKKCHEDWAQGENSPNYKGREVRTCLYCGQEFECMPDSTRKWCNGACYGKYMSKDGEHPLRTGRYKECEICGNLFWVVPSQEKLGYGRFCSFTCQHKWQVGPNNTMWRGAEQEYPPEFNNEFKESIRSREDEKCFICRQPQIPGYRLDVHHIDGTKTNTSPANCVALCKSCHMTIHTTREREAEWAAKLPLMVRERYA